MRQIVPIIAGPLLLDVAGKVRPSPAVGDTTQTNVIRAWWLIVLVHCEGTRHDNRYCCGVRSYATFTESAAMVMCI